MELPLVAANRVARSMPLNFDKSQIQTKIELNDIDEGNYQKRHRYGKGEFLL